MKNLFFYGSALELVLALVLVLGQHWSDITMAPSFHSPLQKTEKSKQHWRIKIETTKTSHKWIGRPWIRRGPKILPFLDMPRSEDVQKKTLVGLLLSTVDSRIPRRAAFPIRPLWTSIQPPSPRATLPGHPGHPASSQDLQDIQLAPRTSGHHQKKWGPWIWTSENKRQKKISAAWIWTLENKRQKISAAWIWMSAMEGVEQPFSAMDLNVDSGSERRGLLCFSTCSRLCSSTCSRLCSSTCSRLCSSMCSRLCSSTCSWLCSSTCSWLCSLTCSRLCSLRCSWLCSLMCSQLCSSMWSILVSCQTVYLPSSWPTYPTLILFDALPVVLAVLLSMLRAVLLNLFRAVLLDVLLAVLLDVMSGLTYLGAPYPLSDFRNLWLTRGLT